MEIGLGKGKKLYDKRDSIAKKMSAEKMNAISKLKIYRLIFSPPTGRILPVVKIRACTGFDGGFEFGEASRKAMRQIPN